MSAEIRHFSSHRRREKENNTLLTVANWSDGLSIVNTCRLFSLSWFFYTHVSLLPRRPRFAFHICFYRITCHLKYSLSDHIIDLDLWLWHKETLNFLYKSPVSIYFFGGKFKWHVRPFLISNGFSWCFSLTTII